MSFAYEERTSYSPLVSAAWRSSDSADGTYLAAADGSWDMIFTQRDQKTTVLLSGPSSKATPVRYQAGNRNIGIRFCPGVIVEGLPAAIMRDKTIPVNPSGQRFWLGHKSWEMPSFESIDDFVQKLSVHGVIKHDPIVNSVLEGGSPDLTQRSIQRRFLHATGLAPSYHRQIERANKAVALLQSGKSIMQVVHELGYADQAHMTRIVKQVSGCTPGQVVKKAEACRLRSIQNYGVCGQMKVQNFKGGYDARQTIQN